MENDLNKKINELNKEKKVFDKEIEESKITISNLKNEIEKNKKENENKIITLNSKLKIKEK